MYIKWVGGKRRIAPAIMEIVEGRTSDFARLTEPFAGGAALSCYYRGVGGRRRVRLYDVNKDLIALHRSTVGGRDFFLDFVEAAWSAFKRDDYYTIRDTFNSRKLSEFSQAAMFLWMNKYGFNGLCRYNRSGEFNVPKGSQSSEPTAPIKEMKEFAKMFRRDLLEVSPFQDSMKLENSIAGELFYCDPPYLGTFSNYAAGGFGCDEHIELARMARVLGDNGRKVVVSNSDCPDTLSVYSNADEIIELSSMQSVSRDASSRGATREVVALYGF